MEIQKETMINVTKNLQGIKVEMPKVNIVSGTTGSNSINSMDTVLQAIGIDKLDQISNIK